MTTKPQPPAQPKRRTGRIIWCCIPIAIFGYGLFRVVGFAFESAPFIGWFGPLYVCSLYLGFFLLWVARLVIAIKEYRHE